MQSRVVREGSVGLLLLLGLGGVIGIVAWLRGANLGGQYSLAVELSDALGLDTGSPVKYRGVKVGRVRSVTSDEYGVQAQVEIPTSVKILRDSEVSVTQSGFIGQVELSIQPKQTLSRSASFPDLSPLKPNCDAKLIFCDGDRLSGTRGVSFDELIRATTKLTELLSNSQIIDTANTTLKTANTTALSITQLSRGATKTLRDVSLAANSFTGLSKDARQQLQQFGPVTASVTKAADQVGVLGTQFGGTATRITAAADQVTALVQDNRGALMNTLGNLQDASQDLKGAVKDLSPILSRLEKGKLLDNLETLADNGAKATANLKTLTSTLNNPITVLGLAQTLDSARVTFQNTQKITTDLEELTGNAKFRQNLIRLINGLSKLVSSTQTLEQQIAVVRQVPEPLQPNQPVVPPSIGVLAPFPVPPRQDVPAATSISAPLFSAQDIGVEPLGRSPQPLSPSPSLIQDP